MKRIGIALTLFLCLSLCGCTEAVTVNTPKADDAPPDAIADNKVYMPEVAPFDPSECTVWTANCEEYITLWTSPASDEIITTIPKGEKMTLLGWNERYAYVTFGEEEGYVNAAYIKPADEEYFAKCLNVVEITGIYSYEQMLADVEIIAKKYSELVETEIIEQSELGRDIPVIRIGREDAKYHVILQGAIHGREYVTAWCIMAMMDYWLDNGIEAFADICWHIVPMINPDGVVISQTGELSEEQHKIYNNDLAIGIFPDEIDEYTKMWKSNGKGTDINRNFPAGWDYVNDFTMPSSAYFKGEEPFSAAEARALRDYTLQYDFAVTVSYHSSGSVIYWQYGDKQPVNDLSYELGEAVNAVTGYTLIGSDSVEGAGYKDWAINSLEIPSLTIEIGCGESPLNERELYSIFARNYLVLPAIAKWVTE